MEVKLIYATPINIALEAGLICTDSEDKIGNYDSKEFISKLVSQGHESIIEHINYNFRVNEISRAVLQELARHRHISLSVKSTRWALKKIKDKITFYHPDTKDNNVILNNLDIKIEEIKELLKEGIESGIPNDILKYYIPESLTTKLILTVNARELRHIFNLRTSDRALREFQVLCMYIYNALPEDHRFMYEDVYKFE
jgi:thymidylate synthase (FAD)